MRIDFQPGDHLRVGRFIICRARNAEGAPVIDGGSTGLVHHDEKAAVEVVRRTAVLVDVLDQDVIDPEMVQELAAGVRQSLATYEAAREVEHFGSIVISPWRLALGWQDARTPMPARWRPRFLLERARWVLAGRPANVVSLGVDNSAGHDDGSVPAAFDTPFGDRTPAQREAVELWQDPRP